jgi:hypothetical protein
VGTELPNLGLSAARIQGRGVQPGLNGMVRENRGYLREVPRRYRVERRMQMVDIDPPAGLHVVWPSLV